MHTPIHIYIYVYQTIITALFLNSKKLLTYLKLLFNLNQLGKIAYIFAY